MKRAAHGLGLGVLAASIATSAVAQADDDAAIAFAVAGVSAAVGADVTFTAYSGGTAARVEEPDFGWMTAQSIVMTPQALAINVGMAAAAAEDDDEGYTLAILPVASWLNALSVHAVWSVGAPGAGSPDARFGVSWLAGTNAAFTAAAMGALADERVSPLWISVPEVGLMGGELAFATVRAVQDENWRGGWIALAAWSGVLTIHGVVSVIGEIGGWNREHSSWDDPPVIAEPPDPVPPDHPDPLQVPEPLPPARKPPPPLLVPAPVGDGASLGPGIMLVGGF